MLVALGRNLSVVRLGRHLLHTITATDPGSNREAGQDRETKQIEDPFCLIQAGPTHTGYGYTRRQLDYTSGSTTEPRVTHAMSRDYFTLKDYK